MRGAAAVAVLLALVLGGCGGNEPVAAPTPTGTPTTTPTTTAAPPSRSSASATPRAPATTRPPSTSPTPSPAPVTRATGPTITASRAKVSLTLPRTWSGASTESGPAAAARQLYPDDAAQAAKAQRFFSGLPTSTVLFGLDVVTARTARGFVPNLNLLVDTSLPGDDLERTADAQVAGLQGGYTLTERKTVDLGDVLAVRLAYQVSQPRSVGVVYVVKPRRVTYLLTVSFPTLSARALALADGTAATLRLP